VKHRQRVRVSTDINPHCLKVLHDSRSRKPRSRLRAQNLATHFWKTAHRSKAIIICQRFQCYNSLLKLSDSIRQTRKLDFPLLKLGLRSQVTGLIGIYEDVRHGGKYTMRRVKLSSKILHTINIDNKGLGWDGLILAAEGELRQIEKRANQLREALEMFRKRKDSGEPFVGTSTRI
jgi:hypothetical protein